MYMYIPVFVQVEFCIFIVRYPQQCHPCTVDTFLVLTPYNSDWSIGCIIVVVNLQVGSYGFEYT